MSNFPEVIILISGKRKSGKDFISEKLLKIIGSEKCGIVRISEPIKSHYAKEKNLSLSELMSDNPYKEHYRLEMINWSDEVRGHNPGFFCSAACTKGAHFNTSRNCKFKLLSFVAHFKPIWIVSDIRRKTDIKWFKDTYGDKIKTVRISVDNEVRKDRGFVFTKGIDDVTSECDLDDFNAWNLSVTNNNNEELNLAIQQILDLLQL